MSTPTQRWLWYHGIGWVRLPRKDIEVKRSKNKQKPIRNEETSTRERFEANIESRIKTVVEKSQERKEKSKLFARLIEEFGFALHRVRSQRLGVIRQFLIGRRRDKTDRLEWEPIEEERLEEPKEGWMLGESKKRSIRISSRMLIVGLVPSRVG
ncbi:hypothetical protein Tco_1302099 [Tanacetum coccineum]